MHFCFLEWRAYHVNLGDSIIVTFTILEVPYYNYNIPQNRILIIKAPILEELVVLVTVVRGGSCLDVCCNMLTQRNSVLIIMALIFRCPMPSEDS